MNKTHFLSIFALISLWLSSADAGLVISNVRAAQKIVSKPSDAKVVDIWYDADDDGTPSPPFVSILVSNDDGKSFSLFITNLLYGDFYNGDHVGKNRVLSFGVGDSDFWKEIIGVNKVCPNLRIKLIPGSYPDLLDESKSAISNRTFVDTRDPVGDALDPLDGVPMLVDERPGNHRLISYEMPMQNLPRPSAGTVTVYSQIKIPNFAKKNGGWGPVEGGLGTFYGLEMTAFPSLDAPFVDSIQYKVGGDPPTPNTPESHWKPASFNAIIDTFVGEGGGPLKEETYYFKITLVSGSGSLPISAQFKSARLCTNMGEPVRALESGSPLWLIIHGKNDGEKSFRSMNSAVRKGTGSGQVVSLDWASGADGVGLGNGRYFENLGKNMDALLETQRLSRSNVNCIGHSWGTLVGYEIAASFGGFNRFIALDPATQVFGGYDDDRVNFRRISSFSTGVKGGEYQLSGLYGSEAKTKTCHLSIRLISGNHLVQPLRFPSFFHSLPRDWLERSMTNSRDAYWPFFKGRLLKKASREMPWGENYQSLFGFDLECSGTTSSLGGKALFNSIQFIRFRSSKWVPTKATIKVGKTGLKRDDWKYSPNL